MAGGSPSAVMPDDNDRDSARWWRSAVVYQVYIRSFADGNGDGVGDIAGLRSRLGYLAGLGVVAVWITPRTRPIWCYSRRPTTRC
jgi:alpha-glucosidase